MLETEMKRETEPKKCSGYLGITEAIDRDMIEEMFFLS